MPRHFPLHIGQGKKITYTGNGIETSDPHFVRTEVHSKKITYTGNGIETVKAAVFQPPDAQ